MGKAHGIKGEVQVRLVTDLTSRLDPGTVLTTDRGPMTVRASRPHQGVWLVHFEGVTTRNEAEALRGLVLRAEPVDDPEGGDFVHELIGCTVVDTSGVEHGVVESVQWNPAADLLVLGDGRLVPMTFVTEVVAGERVVVDPPAGLLDDE